MLVYNMLIKLIAETNSETCIYQCCRQVEKESGISG